MVERICVAHFVRGVVRFVCNGKVADNRSVSLQTCVVQIDVVSHGLVVDDDVKLTGLFVCGDVDIFAVLLGEQYFAFRTFISFCAVVGGGNVNVRSAVDATINVVAIMRVV